MLTPVKYRVDSLTKTNGEPIHITLKDDRGESWLWAIIWGGFTLNKLDSSWEWESQPSDRTEKYLTENRYTLEEAIDLVNKMKGKKDEQ